MKETMQLLGINSTTNSESTVKQSTELISTNSKPPFNLSMSSLYAPTSDILNSLCHSTLKKPFDDAHLTTSRESSLNSFYEGIKVKMNASLHNQNEAAAHKKSPDDIVASVAAATGESAGEKKAEIKDAFILNQIDLINKYYQIDNKTIVVATAAANAASSEPPASGLSNMSKNSFSSDKQHQTTAESSSSSTVNQELKELAKRMLATKSISNLSSGQKQQPSGAETQAHTSQSHRANDLRHFIEILLNKSPSTDHQQQQATPVNPNSELDLSTPPQYIYSASYTNMPKM